MNNQCKITLGRIVWNSRRSLGLSQRELCQELFKYGVQIDYCQLSKIENDRIDIVDANYDSLIDVFCQIFNLDTNYIHIIRQQTEVSPSGDLSQAVFPIYMKDLN
jgi:transcriptional regulator with XRE-family HTH domain